MIPKYVLKLGLKIYPINVKAQKIDNFTFKMFEMVLASFQIENTLKKAQFFQKIFLFINFSVKIVLEILFLTFSNIDIKFA